MGRLDITDKGISDLGQRIEKLLNLKSVALYFVS